MKIRDLVIFICLFFGTKLLAQPPAIPNAIYTVSYGCNAVTISRTNTPPAGTTWYWQAYSWGTATTNYGNSFTVNVTDRNLARVRIFILARLTNSPWTWQYNAQELSDGTTNAGFAIKRPSAAPSTSNEVVANLGATINLTDYVYARPPEVRLYKGNETVPLTNSYVLVTQSQDYYATIFDGVCESEKSLIRIKINVPTPTLEMFSLSTNTCGAKKISVKSPDPNYDYYLQTSIYGVDQSKPITNNPASYITSDYPNYYIRAKLNYNRPDWSSSISIPSNSTIVNPFDLNATQYDSNVPILQATHSVTLSNGFSVPQGSTFTARIAITEECNNYMNWTESVVYNENAVPIANSRTYYDGFGQALQSQSKNFAANSVLASQTLFDTYNKPAASTLTAPILEKDFIYKRDLAVNASNNPYTAADFDVRTKIGAAGELKTPNPFGTAPGTIGWYYSSANNLEKLTPTTQYPYARSFSPEGPDPTSSISAGPGDQHRMGSNHETKSDRYNITNELTHYYSLRAANTNAFGTSPTPTLAILGYFYVATDPDGKRTASFMDADGRSVASALITSPTSVTQPPFAYDYWSYTYYNDLGQVVATVAPKGVNTASTAMPGFVTYYKYDHLGQLIETTSPDEGTSRFVYSIDGKIRFSQNQEQANAAIKRFSYTNYDYLGRLVESGEYSSSGTNPFVFEPATTLQPATYSILRFTDINDNPGPVPSTPPGNPGGGGPPGSGSGNPGGGGAPGAVPTYATWPIGDVRCTDVTKIYYDTQPSDFPADASHPTQTYLYGQVAKTVNANATTWYGYDENGQLLWSKQNIAGLGIKTIDYTYDFVGNVTRVAYQAGATNPDAFYHHYTYDINQRLVQVATSKDGANQTLQAKYYYYLHGPLKRVELAGSLQGIDYVYNINGSLKSINDVDIANDPGKDGTANAFSPDAFGMTLNYYNNDYQGAAYTATNVAGNPSSNSFGGLIKSQSWFTPVDLGASKKAYAYTYDNRNQFQNAQWGNITGTTGNFTATFDANAYKENITGYDKNGNILNLKRNDKKGNALADYSYTYKPNNNQLAQVTGRANPVVYTYNAIGQMTQETEGVNTLKVTYNAYGLVSEVRDAADKLIESFAYDDRGDKLSRTFYAKGVGSKKTFYVHDASGNVLAMYDQTLPGNARLVELPIYGAGRIGEYKPGGLQGDRFLYELTDHLGNVRAVIGKPYTEANQATVETLRAAQELNAFPNLDRARRINSNIFDHTFDGNVAATTVNGAYSVRLSGTGTDGNTREKYGLAREISVMPGDRVQMEVYAKYLAIPPNSNAFLTGLVANMVAGSTGLGGIIDGKNYAITSSSDLKRTDLIPYGTSPDDGAPRAYLAYMVFDKNWGFKPEKSGFKKISTLAAETGAGVTSYASEGKAHEKLSITLDVTEPGYVYVYLTNQEATPKEVYFDDFTVTQLHSPFVAGGDYYPFGLPMADRQMDAEPYKWGYQGQYAEKDSLMKMNSFDLRMNDPDFARWTTTDPYGQYASSYVSMGNNPVNGVDPNGGFSINWSRISALFSGGKWYKLNHAYGGFVKGGGLIGGLGRIGLKGLDFLSKNDEIWLPLTKEILKSYIKNRGCQNCSDGNLENEVGDRFENTWNRYASQNLMPADNYRPNRDKYDGNGRNVVPDGIGDAMSMNRFGRKKTYRDAAWYEVKAKNGNIYSSTSNGQIRGHIDAMKGKYQAAIAGSAANLNFITTSEVSLSPSMKAYSLGNGIAVNHFVAKYRMVHGNMQVKFALRGGAGDLMHPLQTPVDL